MSWLFSQALVAAYSADTCSDGEPSAPSSGNPTQLAFLPPDRMTAFSRLSRFGMTFKPLTEDRGAALLTSYLAGFRARTSAQPEKAPASTASAAACGSTWPELSVKYCLASSSWKTHRSLWDEDLPWSSVTLPRWGMTRNGHVLAHPTLERPISASVSGLWPTPTCQDNIQEAGQFTSKTGTTLGFAARFWTTPSATDGQRCGTITESMTGTSLPQQVNTPERWPTPTATQHKGWSKNHNRADTDDRIDYTIEREAHQAGETGRLNPTWVEWLMGWPLGWTDLKPLAMDRFREWQQQHSASSPDGATFCLNSPP
jgi:hypothetical protein